MLIKNSIVKLLDYMRTECVAGLKILAVFPARYVKGPARRVSNSIACCMGCIAVKQQT